MSVGWLRLLLRRSIIALVAVVADLYGGPVGSLFSKQRLRVMYAAQIDNRSISTLLRMMMGVSCNRTPYGIHSVDDAMLR